MADGSRAFNADSSCCSLKEARQTHMALWTLSPNIKAEWIPFQLGDSDPSLNTTSQGESRLSLLWDLHRFNPLRVFFFSEYVK